MTSERVNSFVGDLVEMAKAMERLPQVEQTLRHTEQANTELLDKIQRLELQLRDSHNETQNCLATIRKVEAERDDAEFRFLESEERTAAALAFIKTTFGSAGSLIQALEPSAPTPVAMQADAPIAVTAQGQSEQDPTVNGAYDGLAHSANPTELVGQVPVNTNIEPGASGFIFHGDPTNADSVSVGERAVDPTSATTQASPFDHGPNAEAK